MKSLMQNFIAIVMLLLTNQSLAATGEPLFHIKVLGAKTIQFDTKGIAASTIEVTFADAEGMVIFSEYTPSPQTFERAYNLEELKDGTYFLIIKSDDETQKLIVTINDNEVIVNRKDQERL